MGSDEEINNNDSLNEESEHKSNFLQIHRITDEFAVFNLQTLEFGVSPLRLSLLFHIVKSFFVNMWSAIMEYVWSSNL